MKNIFKLNEILIISLIILILISFIFLINIPVYKYFLSIKENLLLDIKESTGYEINYKNISPNIIGKINVFEVVLYNPDGTRLELGDIEITYSILSFFRRTENLLSFIKKIKLKTLNLRLDREKLIRQINNLKNNFAGRKNRNIKIKYLTIEIPRGKLNISDKEKSFIIETDDLKIVFNSDIKIDSRLNFTILKNEEKKIDARLKTKGIISKEDKIYTSNFDLQFDDFIFGKNKLRIQRFTFESKGKDFILTRIKDGLPVTFNIMRRNGLIFSDINIENLNVEELFIANKKSFYIPDRLSLKNDMFFDPANKDIEGILKLKTDYNKLLYYNNFSTDIDINVKDEIVYVNNFFINHTNKQKYIDLKGVLPLYPKDFQLVLNIKDFEIPKSNINTEIKLTRSGNDISLKGDYFLLNGEDIGQLDIIMTDKGRIYEISSLNTFNGYSLNGDLRLKDKGFSANLDHNFSDFSLTRILRGFDQKPENNIVLNGLMSTAVSDDDLRIKRTDFTVKDEEKELSTFSVYMNNKILFLNDLIIKNNSKPTKISSWIDFKRKPLLANIQLEKNNMKFNIYSRISNESIGFTINRRLYAGINLENNYIYLRADSFRLPFKRSTAEFNFNLALNLDNMSISRRDVFINKVNIFNNKSGTIRAKISLWNNKLYIKDFVYKDDSNYIDGESVHDFDLKDRLFITGKGFLRDDNKKESYSLDYKIEEDNINAKLYITHMESEKLVPKIKGFLNVRLNVYDKLLDPNINLDFDLADANINNIPASAFCIIKKDDTGINIKKGSFQFAQSRLSIKNSSIQLEENNNKLGIHGTVFAEALQKKLKTNFSITGSFKSLNMNNPEMNIDLEFNNATLGIIKGYKLEDIKKFDPLKINISNKEETLVIKNYGEKLLYATKNKTDYIIKFYNEENTVFDGNLIIDKGNINGNIDFAKFPLKVLHNVLQPFVGIENGLIDGKLVLSGAPKKPLFSGNLNLYYGVINLPDFLPEPIINITGIINVDKSKFIVSNVNAEVKKGLAHGYGELILNGWKLERYVFHLNSDTVPAHFYSKAVDAKGTGYIKEFIFEGRPKDFNFIGDIYVDSGEVILASLMGVSKKSKIREMPINVIIDFESGKKIRVNHPIFKGIIAPGQKFSVKFIGKEARVYLGGTVALQKGEVNYLNKNFKIEQAVFQFFEDEVNVNPNVNLKAYYRTKDSRKEPVKIYLTINNRFIPFETNFSAFPYKTQEEINGLLGLSFAYNTNENDPTEIEKDIDSEANINTLVNTANYLSNSFMLTPVENRIRNITGLDTFSMKTEFLGNIIRSNNSYIGKTLDLIDGSSITIGKYIFNELYFESMMSLHKYKTIQDQFFLPFNDENYGLNLQFMLQLELPFFLIGYSFLPKDYTNLLDADHQISLEANFRL